MRVHSPTSRSGSRIYLSIWDLSWALTAPVLALYLRDPNVIFNSDSSALTYLGALCSFFGSGFVRL